MHSTATSRPGAQSPAEAATAKGLPARKRILSWVYMGRLILASALFARAFWQTGTGPVVEAAVVGILLGALIFTALSFGYSHGGKRSLPEWFVYVQLVFDALLLTIAVQLTGGAGSAFAALYILLIAAAALLLPTLGGILIGLLAITLYAASIVWTTGGSLGGSVWLQMALFAIVALVTGYLANRLRAAGAALGEVETELAQLRLDTGDILNTMNTGVLTVDGDRRLAYLNPAAEEILELPASEWVGRPIIHELDRIAPGLGRVIARSAEERIAIRRFETDPIEDQDFVLGVSTTLVDRDQEGSPAVTAIFQDITEKVRLENLRRRAERLEAVAELSASLAHEIKNPLASIRSAVEQIAGDGVDPEDAAVLKGLATRESDRLSRLLAEFIDFARVKVTTPEPVDLAVIVKEVTELVRAHPDCRACEIRIVSAPLDDSLRIRGSEDVLHRAIFNLVLNGAQWAGENGRVDISLDSVRSDLLSPALGALGLVRLTVTDTGPGIPPGIVEHIFDPFFTRRQGGTGLGLAMVQRAVEAHGGAIFVENAPELSGLGATFTVYIPALPPEAAELPPDEENRPGPRARSDDRLREPGAA